MDTEAIDTRAEAVAVLRDQLVDSVSLQAEAEARLVTGCLVPAPASLLVKAFEALADQERRKAATIRALLVEAQGWRREGMDDCGAMGCMVRAWGNGFCMEHQPLAHHKAVYRGACPACGHYGEDCTGVRS